MASTLQISQNHGCKKLPHFVPSIPPLRQIFAMPFTTLKATIVLPDFVRSELHLSEAEFSEFFTS
jgi:hypothetical protein